MMTTTLIKILLGSLLIFLIPSNLFKENVAKSKAYKTITKSEDFVKLKAFEVLTNKCNVCHRKRNKRRVFTTENMDGWVDEVYKQVFIKKRMPKGKDIKLTSKEYQDLLTWISSTKN